MVECGVLDRDGGVGVARALDRHLRPEAAWTDSIAFLRRPKEPPKVWYVLNCKHSKFIQETF